MDICILGLKGGIGKTTTAIHLAAYMQQFGDTLLIDADKNASALRWADRGNLPFKVCNVEGAVKHIRKAKHIVADTKARPEREDIKAVAKEYDLLIMPSPPRVLDLDALLKTRDILVEYGTNYKALLTITPPPRKRPGGSEKTPSSKEQEARELLEAEEIPVFVSTIYQYTAIEKSPLAGVTVDQYEDSYSTVAWECYQNLGREIYDGKK
jgi:chromosome partitioning protein